LQEEEKENSFLSRTFVLSERVVLFYHRYNNISIYFLQFGYILLFSPFPAGHGVPICTRFRFVFVFFTGFPSFHPDQMSFFHGFALCGFPTAYVFPERTFLCRYNFLGGRFHFPKKPFPEEEAFMPVSRFLILSPCAAGRSAPRPRKPAKKPCFLWKTEKK